MARIMIQPTMTSFFRSYVFQLSLSITLTVLLTSSFHQPSAFAAVVFSDGVDKTEDDFTFAISADKGERFELDAEKLTYEDVTGIASADGSVDARGSGMRILAPSVVYDTHEGIIIAQASDDEKIILITGGLKLVGQRAEYNLNSGEGMLTQPSGKVDAIFFKGSDIVVMPLEKAVRQKLVTGRSRSGGADRDIVAFWADASATTCDFSEPHYKLVSSKVVVYPNRRAVLKRPRVYIEKRMVFQYPFDYVIPLNKKDKTTALMPRLMYNSDNGAGLGISGPIVLGDGQIDISAVYWKDGIWEAELEINQKLGRDFTIYAKTSRLYNKDDRDTLWRPSWGIVYETLDGWTAKLHGSERELIETEMRPGQDRRYNLWRSPEFEFFSPWLKFAPGHFFKFGGIWGKYQDNVTYTNLKVDRLVGAVELYGEPSIGIASFRPFYRASYLYHDYGVDDRNQKVTDLTAGFHWAVGRATFSTAYVRRWVNGSSPLTWDNYLDREDLYQQITFMFPGTRAWETWEVSVRAGYDFIDARLNEMVYAVSYNKHCLTWQLYAKDSRPKNELSVGLRFIVNAYPNQALNLGEPKIYNPFARPVPARIWNNK